MSELALAVPQKLQDDRETWTDKASKLKVHNAVTFEQAGQMLTFIKGCREEIQKYWQPHIEGAQETKRAAEANRKRLVESLDKDEKPLVDAEALLKDALVAYDTEQTRIAAAEQRRLEEAARKEAERRQLEEAAALEREAKDTGDEHLLAEAMELFEAKVETPSITVTKNVPKVAGVVLKDNWQADEKVDVVALAKVIGTKKVESILLTPNMTALNQIAKATKGTRKIPGVKFVNRRGVSAEAR